LRAPALFRRRRRSRREWYRDVYLRSAHWRSLRIWALEAADWRCQRCGKTMSVAGGSLDVHHKHYRTVGHERPSDLEVLCRPCHERKGRRWL
jgi:5-methylcytosine-specific restriction endonuclease McrA